MRFSIWDGNAKESPSNKCIWELWNIFAFLLTKLLIFLSGPMQYSLQHFTQAKLPSSCVVAYVTIFSLMLLQKYNELSLIQSSCPNEVSYFSYINNVVNFQRWAV